MFLTVVKAVAELACIFGSEAIVCGLVKTVASPTKNKALNACVKVATVCIGGMVGAEAGKYADEQIDWVAEQGKKLTSKAGEETDGAA